MTEKLEIRELVAQDAAIERATTDAAGIGAVVDRAFPALFEALEKQGMTPGGAPFIRFLQTGERLEIELGVPVPAGHPPLDRVEQTTLPAGRAAVLRYVGPYDGLADAGERLLGWVVARGEQPAGPRWETYVTDPRTEPDPNRRVTEIYVPLR